MRIAIGYPPLAEEARMLAEQTTEPPLDPLAPVATVPACSPRSRRRAPSTSRRASTAYVVRLVRHTRASSRLALGASPRAGIALLRVAKARALAASRDYVLPDDVKAVAAPVLAHRLIVAPEARATGLTAEEAVEEALAEVPVPA